MGRAKRTGKPEDDVWITKADLSDVREHFNAKFQPG